MEGGGVSNPAVEHMMNRLMAMELDHEDFFRLSMFLCMRVKPVKLVTTNQPLQFGDVVHVTAKLVRRKDGSKRYWERAVFDTPRPAVFIIMRTWQNGNVDWESYDEGGRNIWFESKEYLKGAWVGIEGIGPEKVLLEDCVR